MLKQERVEKEGKASGDDLSSVELALPSRCVDYPGPAQKPFQVRPPRVKEVEFLAGMSAANYDEQLTRLLRSLIVFPTIVDPADLTIGDRQFLHVWVRAQIDPVYRFKAQCPACGEIDEHYQLDIQKIPIIPVPERYRPNMKLTLPRSKKVVAVRLETGRDRGMRDQFQDEGIGEWTVRCAMVVVSVDGKTMDLKDKCRWMQNLPGGDDLFMAQYLKWQRHGPDFSNCSFKCRSEKCGKESVLNMPFRVEFYMPTIHAASAFEDAIRGGGVGADGDLPGDAGDQADGVRGVPVGEAAAAGAQGEGPTGG